MSFPPTSAQWARLWRLWDAATLLMIPPGHHSDRPLELRQPFVFYVGHLPAFADARLASVLLQSLTEPAHFADLFARGIDPDLDNPTLCHAHSPTPAQWPPVDKILAYRDRVRARILQLYSSSSSRVSAGAVDINAPSTPSSYGNSESSSSSSSSNSTQNDAAAAALPSGLQHVLWMSFEHEAMHLETLLYMLVQYEAVQPPPQDLMPANLPQGAWRSDSAAASSNCAGAAVSACSLASGEVAAGKGCRRGLLPLPPAAAWVELAPCNVTLGFTPQPSTSSSSSSSNSGDSSSSSSSRGLQFGWDNECPAREVSVAGFRMQHRPVTVLEYLQFAAHRLAEVWVNQSPPSAPTAAALAGAEAANANADASVSGHKMQAGGRATAVSSSSSSSSTSRQQQTDDSIAAPSSSSLPQLLSDIQALLLQSTDQQQQQPCDGCLGVLLQLLQTSTAQSILPASLVLTHSSTAGSNDISHSSSSTDKAATAEPDLLLQPAASSSCCGLCMLSVPSTSGVSSAYAVSTAPQTGPQQQAELESALLDALQLHLGVKTVFGSAPISVAGYWPVYCSALQAEQYAAWLSASQAADSPAQSCRLPTEPEVLAARQHTASLAHKTADDDEGELPQGADFAVWHPLCVQLQAADREAVKQGDPSAPTGPSSNSSSSSNNGSSSSSSAAADGRALPVSQLCDNGWEWTCTPFSRHEGFQAHPLYPEYSQDFFGGKHVVLLGASWATVGPIAGRSTFRNWYQKGQQHVFAKFRCCLPVMSHARAAALSLCGNSR